MAINKKLIYFYNKKDFENEVANGNILDHSIVFIQDSKEISTRGEVYKSINWSVLEESKELVINSAGKPNGVYVVTKDGELVDKSTVAADALGVALITANQRILIEKNGESNTDIIKAAYDADNATNTEYKYFYWGMYNSDVAGITEITESSVAKTDFNGKANTAAIIASPDTDDKTTYANMGTYCTKFNEMSGTYSDWYIPAAGQLYEMYNKMSDINTALQNIGGTVLESHNFWSSSELGVNNAWNVNFNSGYVNNANKDSYHRVRFVRNIN